jgi:hypothetical protein
MLRAIFATAASLLLLHQIGTQAIFVITVFLKLVQDLTACISYTCLAYSCLQEQRTLDGGPLLRKTDEAMIA